MTDGILAELASYTQDILGYSVTDCSPQKLAIHVPENAALVGRMAGSDINITKNDVENCSGQFSWLAEHISEQCPTVYKAKINSKKMKILPANWQKEVNSGNGEQLLLSWWNVGIRAVNIREELLLLAFVCPAEGEPRLLPTLVAADEIELVENLPMGAVSPKFSGAMLEKISLSANRYFERELAPKVAAAMAEVEKQRQEQLEQIATYYFLTSKRMQERAVADAGQQRWQLESLAQDKARLEQQINQRYAAESVVVNIAPELVVLCEIV